MGSIDSYDVNARSTPSCFRDIMSMQITTTLTEGALIIYLELKIDEMVGDWKWALTQPYFWPAVNKGLRRIFDPDIF